MTKAPLDETRAVSLLPYCLVGGHLLELLNRFNICSVWYSV